MAWMREDVEALLHAVRRGEAAPDVALDRLATLPYRELGFARVDVHRELRQGAPEVVLAEGKSPQQVAQIVATMIDEGSASVLVSRADADVRAAVREVAPEAEEHEIA